MQKIISIQISIIFLIVNLSLYINNCLNIKNKVEMLSDLKILYNYSFKNINFSPNSFILKFKQNAPFKV